MKYQDFIQFDPITTVIELRTANEMTKAEELVKSYIFSDTMAERFTNIILPKLNYISQNDSKGILVVGNYGTGKSHFMSVISAICEYPNCATLVTHSTIANHAMLPDISGKFKVIRSEIGAVQTSLKDIIFTLIKEQLRRMNVEITIPHEPQINNKNTLDDIMSNFHTVYPDHGLLIVVDELLDYLRSRKDQELILDLSFLRELGEVCSTTRLRFIAGVQEAIFDSDQFLHVADMLRRVRDRFDQILIARNDIKYVVGERLLKKTTAQKAQIRQHLEKFTRFFPNMMNRMDEYVQLFPVHPDYINVFDELRIIEKREVLKTLSELMRRNLENDVPDNQPGLFAYESYWTNIKENPVLRADENIRTVIDRSDTIETRLRQLPAFKRPYAQIILNALSIQRLTTPSINDPLGVTAAELRDTLTIFNPTVTEINGTAPDDDLKGYIETLLSDISKVMNSQFVSHNSANGQWYLDLQKNEDFDANISARATTIDTNALDRAYFGALKQQLELTEQPTHVTGYNIWQYELEWIERHAARLGYLFFGAPNERSTAVPIREFYVYFIQPFAPPRYSDNQLADEVFIKLTKRDAEFDDALRFAAAALDLSSTSAGQSKSVYASKTREYNTRVFNWLSQNMLKVFEVTHQGRTQLLESWYREQSRNQSITQTSPLNFRDSIRAVSSYCLNAHFVQCAPEYPKFSVRINRLQAATEALRAIAGQNRTQPAQAVLDALQLLVNDRIDTSKSVYAQYITSILHNKGDGQVVNQSELITTQHSIGYMAPNRFRLEPELVIVVLAALIYTGHIEMNVTGTNYDATKLLQLANSGLDQLLTFKHIKRPQDYNLPVLRALMQLLDLAPGVAQSITQNSDDAVAQVQTKIQGLINSTIQLTNTVRQGVAFWGRDVLHELGMSTINTQLSELKEFLERLTPFNTAARFKNIQFTTADINQQTTTINTIRVLHQTLETTNSLTPIVGWLINADNNLPSNHPWRNAYIRTRDEIVDSITQLPKAGQSSTPSVQQLLPKLQQLKKTYADEYCALHNQQRLHGADIQHKQQLINDERYTQLNTLASIDMLPRQQLNEFQNTLSTLKECQFLSTQALDLEPLCPICNFRPVVEASQSGLRHQLSQLDIQLDSMITQWIKTLINNLDDPTCLDSIKLLDVRNRLLIDTFISSQSLPNQDIKPFAAAVNEVFRGFIAKRISIRDVYRKLRLADGAVAPEELKRRFLAYIDELAQGHALDRVRIIIDESTQEDA